MQQRPGRGVSSAAQPGHAVRQRQASVGMVSGQDHPQFGQVRVEAISEEAAQAVAFIAARPTFRTMVRSQAVLRSFSIGALARAAGVGVETVRFYERQGLIEQPSRPAHGRRRYGADQLERLSFIRAAKATGFTRRKRLNSSPFVNGLPASPAAPLRRSGWRRSRRALPSFSVCAANSRTGSPGATRTTTTRCIRPWATCVIHRLARPISLARDGP